MKEFFIGTDVGSTTVKIVCLDEEKILFILSIKDIYQM